MQTWNKISKQVSTTQTLKLANTLTTVTRWYPLFKLPWMMCFLKKQLGHSSLLAHLRQQLNLWHLFSCVGRSSTSAPIGWDTWGSATWWAAASTCVCPSVFCCSRKDTWLSGHPNKQATDERHRHHFISVWVGKYPDDCRLMVAPGRI